MLCVNFWSESEVQLLFEEPTCTATSITYTSTCKGGSLFYFFDFKWQREMLRKQIGVIAEKKKSKSRIISTSRVCHIFSFSGIIAKSIMIVSVCFCFVSIKSTFNLYVKHKFALFFNLDSLFFFFKYDADLRNSLLKI